MEALMGTSALRLVASAAMRRLGSPSMRGMTCQIAEAAGFGASTPSEQPRGDSRPGVSGRDDSAGPPGFLARARPEEPVIANIVNAVLDRRKKTLGVREKEAHVRSALLKLVKHPHVEPRHLTTVLSGLKRQGRVAEMFKALKIARVNGFDTNRYHFSAILSVMGFKSSWEHMREAYLMMLELADPKTNYELSAKMVCNALIKTRRQMHITEVLQDFHAHGVLREAESFNGLISSFFYARHFGAALKVYEFMVRNGIEPNSRTLGLAIRVTCGTRNAQRCLQVLDEMLANGHVPERVAFDPLLDVLVKEGDTAALVSLTRRLKGLGIELNPFRYLQLIRACGEAQKLDHAIELFRGIPLDQVNGRHYGALINACAQCKSVELAFKFFDELVKGDEFIDERHLVSLVHAFAERGDWRGALEVFDQIEEFGIQPNKWAYNALLLAYDKGKQYSKVHLLLDDMRIKGIELDDYTFTTAIQACSSNNDWREALDLYEEAEELGVRLGYVAYRPLISALQSRKQLQLSLELYEKALGERVFTNYDASFEENKGRSVSLDLHKLSPTLARVSLLSWLRFLKRELLLGNRFDGEEFYVVTGWGKHSNGVSPVKESVIRLLAGGLGPPLAYAQPDSNPGRFEIKTRDMYAWLRHEVKDLF